jgi:short-subunit dehydrogenase
MNPNSSILGKAEAGRLEPRPRNSLRRNHSATSMSGPVDKRRFGPWAVVTGASSGIGLEFARRLAESGINVVLVSRRPELLEEIGAGLAREFGVEYRVVEADLAMEGGTKIVADMTVDLDVGLLVSNAGTGRPGNFLSFTEEDLRWIAQLNAISYLVLTHIFGKRLAARGRGGVLLVSAMGADEGIPYNAQSAATKALVSTLVRGLHLEFQRLGLYITVLVVSPTDTPIFETLGFTKADMPIKPLSVQQCVGEALQALSANKLSIMPGRLYRIMNALMPASVARMMTARMMQKSSRFVV